MKTHFKDLKLHTDFNLKFFFFWSSPSAMRMGVVVNPNTKMEMEIDFIEELKSIRLSLLLRLTGMQPLPFFP